MKITVIGTGYVGLTSGVMMSHIGHQVTCLDTNTEKIKKLKQNILPIFESGLSEYLNQYGNTPDLKFTSSYHEAFDEDTEVIFICVNTPSKKDGDADLTYLFDSVREVVRYIPDSCLLVIKSTVPPGTSLDLSQMLEGLGYNIDLASNPEFLREGTAVNDFLYPDRIVIGVNRASAESKLRHLYKPLTDEGIKIVVTDPATSELIKYAANSFLANKVAFINEMADLCEKTGADINSLSEGVGLDKRIGKKFLKAGPGFGGSCFPKDILALQYFARKVNCDSLILDAVIKANQDRPKKVVSKITQILGGKLGNKKLALLGLTYKAGTDDIRSSPAIDLINSFTEMGCDIAAYDPQGMRAAREFFASLPLANSALEAARNADGVVIITEWPEFRHIDFKAMKFLMKKPVIIDLRNLLDQVSLEQLGYKYFCIGKKHAN